MINSKKLVELYKKQKKKIKLRRIINNHYGKTPLAVSMFLLVVVFICFGIFKTPTSSVVGIKLGKVISATLSDKPDLVNLNFKNVKRFEVQNASKTVIFIPQLHKEPTSNQADSTNDQALIVQKEISNMLRTLVNDNHVTYVMDETDNFGPMPEDKIEIIKKSLAEISQLRADVKSLAAHYVKDGGSEETAKQVEADANAKIDGYERAIYLTGGAAVLAATDTNAHVYGSQNPATIKEASKQLQNIVYMEQRINQLESKSGASSGKTPSKTSALSILGSSGKTSNKSPLQPIADFAKTSNNTDLQAEVQKVTDQSKTVGSAKNYETASKATSGSAGSQTNPYANETNLAKLKKMNADATEKFMKIAKDQRSQEAADNVEKMMQENGQNTGILVMGLKHEDQIVSALNKKGISVIVITPESEDGLATK